MPTARGVAGRVPGFPGPSAPTRTFRSATLPSSGSQSERPTLALSVSSRNFLEIQITKLYPRPAESKTLGLGPSNLSFNKLFGRF